MTSTDYLNEQAIQSFIDNAIQEDVGNGDQSSIASIPSDTEATAKLHIKESGIIAGMVLAEKIFYKIDSSLIFERYVNDGDNVVKNDITFQIRGRARSILTAERLVLNCMQRMSGIATKTRHLLEMIKGSNARLLDTRKTTPNFRLAEKWAVKIGGGKNHRFGLYDMIMLKDNHIDFAGGIKKAITATQKYLLETGQTLKIEIETRNLKEVEEVLDIGGVDIIMLDNMMPSEMREAIRMIAGRYITEASGGITEQNIREVAECGIDFISAGVLTHSFKSLDLSLKATSV
ncbi:MAG: carboxylating nicotinate-nucleotide diphosphorylase [Bacteroidetes bacterium]|nr:carboxylating nicotinate-nucleotide diphosphorylase [Bacteroidota bacterium]